MTPELSAAKAAIESKINGRKPAIGVVLGSGMGAFADRLDGQLRMPYGSVPGFRPSSVPGHTGQLVFGSLRGKSLAVLQGRVHLYEGYPAAEVTFPIRALGAVGVKTLIVAGTAGGINRQFRAGTLMAIEDHINFMGDNPLVGGASPDEPPKFVDMSQAYSSRLLEKMFNAAEKLKMELRRGVYAAVKGPNYETPSEVKMLGWLGADAVGMSVVPEVLVARQVGLEVAGLALVTNLAAGISTRRLSHDDVLETTRRSAESFGRLMEEFIASL